MNLGTTQIAMLAALILSTLVQAAEEKPAIKVFVLAGDDNVLESAPITGATAGTEIKYHNPGNAASTRHGIQDIDRYLDLKTYGQNGQEYIELREGAREAIGDLARIFPGYQGQKAELAGLVWFQGIADSGSDAMASEYEKHLSNLIRDLRKDFEAPALPVVVAAAGYGGKDASPRTKMIRDAQIRISEMPEFKGNVFSVDTRQFYRSPEISPKKSPERYNENALSFLEIGEAIGEILTNSAKQQ